MRIAFLGGGNMAGAMIGGLMEKGLAARDVSVVEVVPEQRERLVSQFGVQVSGVPETALQQSETLVLAVKPQDMKTALAPLRGRVVDKLVISVAAGLPIAALARWLGGHGRIVRAMPNMPALIGAGITGAYAAPAVSATERQRAEAVLAAVGEVVWIREERLLDPVTAVSGSGPAYVFWLIEQLERSGVALGLPEETARRLALATVHGAARLAAAGNEPAASLRARVTSKGGTTEAALKVFADEQLAERFERAVVAASRRGAELGALLGKEDA